MAATLASRLSISRPRSQQQAVSRRRTWAWGQCWGFRVSPAATFAGSRGFMRREKQAGSSGRGREDLKNGSVPTGTDWRWRGRRQDRDQTARPKCRGSSSTAASPRGATSMATALSCIIQGTRPKGSPHHSSPNYRWGLLIGGDVEGWIEIRR